MRRLLVIPAILFLLKAPLFAAQGYVIGPTISTTSAIATEYFAGKIFISASSQTISTPTIVLNGTGTGTGIATLSVSSGAVVIGTSAVSPTLVTPYGENLMVMSQSGQATNSIHTTKDYSRNAIGSGLQLYFGAASGNTTTYIDALSKGGSILDELAFNAGQARLNSTGLIVIGNIVSSGSVAQLQFSRRDNNTPAWTLYSAAGEFNIYDAINNATRLSIDTSGRTGVNVTAASDSFFHVAGGAIVQSTSTTAQAIVFRVLNQTGSRIFDVQQNGYVGISTPTPTEALSVVGNMHISGTNPIIYSPTDLRMFSSGGNPTPVAGTLMLGGGDTSATDGRGVQILTVNGGGTPTNRMVFNSGVALPNVYFQNIASLGIGGSTATVKFQVFDGDIKLSTSTGSRGIIFQDGTTQVTAAGGAQFTTTGNDVYNNNSGYFGVMQGLTLGRAAAVGPTSGGTVMSNSIVYARSADGATQSSGCVVAMYLADGANNNIVFTSTTSQPTTLSAIMPGVLLESCTVGSTCKVGTHGIFHVQTSASVSGQFLGFSATRCKVAPNGPLDSSVIGYPLQAIGGAQWAWMNMTGAN